jgi:ribosomal protein S18 acetylase RimI-like enzyme
VAGVLFRTATSADADGVADVYLASRKRFLPFAPLVHSDAEVRRWVADDLIPSAGVTVACRDGGVVGMMAVSRDAEAGWIDQLYVDPSAVARGIGTRLVERAKRELGAPIRLYTFQANDGALRFYERHGFRTLAFGDGSGNEEGCPDVLCEWRG